MPVSRSRDELVDSRLRGFTRKLPGVAKGRTRDLHQARVASRRLREVLPMLQLDRRLADRLERKLRRVTRKFGAVRELDVLMVLLQQLARTPRYDHDALALVSAALAPQRDRARERLLAKLKIDHLRRIGTKIRKAVDSLAEPADRRPTSRGWRWAIDARVGRRASGLKSAIASAGAVYLPDRVHKVRLGLKKLRYAIELESEVSSDAVWRQHAAVLKRAQALLGRLNDRQVLVDRIRQVQAGLTPPTIEAWRGLETLVTSLEHDCRRLHAGYLRDAPVLGALCDAVIATVGPALRLRTASSRRRAG